MVGLILNHSKQQYEFITANRSGVLNLCGIKDITCCRILRPLNSLIHKMITFLCVSVGATRTKHVDITDT